MVQFKKPSFPFFFKRLNRKGGGRDGGSDGGAAGGASGGAAGSEKLRLKKISPGLRWKRRFSMHWFIDGFLFKIVSVFEAMILVLTLCFFYLFCGCHI